MSELRQTNHSFKFGDYLHTDFAHWSESLTTSDVNQIWNDLYRIVSAHPLINKSETSGFFTSDEKRSIYSGLTRELFVCLLNGKRFQYYLENEMSNAEIEDQISNIEVAELLSVNDFLENLYKESAAKRDSDVSMPQASPRESTLENSPTDASRYAERFLADLNCSFENGEENSSGLLKILRYYYLGGNSESKMDFQLSVDFPEYLIADYRKIIETQLNKLSFAEADQVVCFEKSLRKIVDETLAPQN